MQEQRCDLTTSIHVVIISDGDGQVRLSTAEAGQFEILVVGKWSVWKTLPIVILAPFCAARSHSQAPLPEAQTVELQLQVSTPFHFVVYGDSR